MFNQTYSYEIAQAIHNHLKAHDFEYNFDEDRGVFNFLLALHGKAKALIYHIIVHEHGFTSSAQYPLGPDASDEACINTMSRFLHRANFGLRNGNFEMDLNDGEINYKVYCSCRGLEAPSDEMVEENILCAAAMFRRYEPGILGILFNGMNDKDANEHCENSHSGLLSQLDELNARLEALQRGKSEEEDKDEDEDNDDGEGFSLEEFLKRLRENAQPNQGNDGDDDEDDDDGVFDDDIDIIDAE